MDKLTTISPAKINIGLRIIEKREDGYHNLKTIFYPLLLSDVLTFKKNDTTILETDSADIQKLCDNLIIKAKEVLENHVAKKLNVGIHLEKKYSIGCRSWRR